MEENVTEDQGKLHGTIMEREKLDRALDIVSPALSTKEFIPIFTCFCFQGDSFYAYDDLLAIKAEVSTGIHGGARGSMFSKLIKSFASESVTIKQTDKEVRLKSGKVSMKMPVVPESDFILNWPTIDDPLVSIDMDANFFESLDSCLASCAVDTSSPAICGVTVADHDGELTLNSTDRMMITSTSIGPLHSDLPEPVILPTDFCSALSETARRVGKNGVLKISKDRNFAIVEFEGGEYSIFTKLMGAEPIDYRELLNRYSSEDDVYFPVPDELQQMMNRASILMPGENPSCRLTIESGELEINALSSYGDLKDSVDVEPSHPDIEIFIDPANVLRASAVHDTSSVMTVKDRNITFIQGEEKYQLVANKN